MNKIKAIIFDFDGTLVDSEAIHYKSWNTVLKQYNHQLTSKEYFENLAGIPTPANASYLINKLSLKQEVKNLVDKKEDSTSKILKNEKIKFMPFAKELLDFLHLKNIPMSIVTGSPRKELNPILKKESILHYFDYTITRNDVVISKPNPEGYLKCCKLMGFKKNEYLVLEDTQGGITSAKAARLKCFGIQQNIALHHKLQHADRVFNNLEEAFLYIKNNLY